jgi:hypothetical protein
LANAQSRLQAYSAIGGGAGSIGGAFAAGGRK